MAIWLELTILGHNNSLLYFLRRGCVWVKFVRSAHVDLQLVQQDREVEVVIFLINDVPAAEVEINIDGLIFFIFSVISFVESANVLWIELRRDLSQRDVCSKHRLILVGCIDLDYGLDQLLLERWSSLRGPSPRVSPLVNVNRGLLKFEVHFLHYGHHEVIKERRLSRPLRVNGSNDSELV